MNTTIIRSDSNRSDARTINNVVAGVAQDFGIKISAEPGTGIRMECFQSHETTRVEHDNGTWESRGTITRTVLLYTVTHDEAASEIRGELAEHGIDIDAQ